MENKGKFDPNTQSSSGVITIVIDNWFVEDGTKKYDWREIKGDDWLTVWHSFWGRSYEQGRRGWSGGVVGTERKSGYKNCFELKYQRRSKDFITIKQNKELEMFFHDYRLFYWFEFETTLKLK